jgi:hypothetical protein
MDSLWKRLKELGVRYELIFVCYTHKYEQLEDMNIHRIILLFGN